ncbi:hypothetical protein BX600DRAFT_460092 [Xylariales sp. PMI_506]|nr:hypothetical protein BX600DRAFT_460092 [Xylariales sp. PMI_506]
MLPVRSVARSGLPRTAIRASRAPTRFNRLQSTTSSASNASSGGSHISAGIAGGVAASIVLYSIYLMTPSGRMSRTVNKTLNEANKKYQEAAQKLQQSTPDADQTISAIKQFCYSYLAWIPGGRQYVDTAFKDVETVRKNHHEEADKILNDAYKQFQNLSKSGLSMETATKAFDILTDVSKKLGSLAGDALSDIIDNHPELKEKFGGNIDQLKEFSDKYGPEAKEKVEETWKQVRDVLGGGLTAANLDKARSLIQEKVDQMKDFGEEAWKKALEQAKPYLDKNPKIKELVENNVDALKKGNISELFEKAKSAAESGEFGGFEEYVNKALEKGKSKGSEVSEKLGLDGYLDVIPDGADVMSKLKQLKAVAEKHTDEGEQLVKETVQELRKVLGKSSKKAQDILDNAKEESKKESKH